MGTPGPQPKFHGGSGSRSGNLHTILRNIWLNHLRQKRNAPEVVELKAHEEIVDVAIDTSKDPHAQYVSKMEQERVRSAVPHLPAEFREIVILREYEELADTSDYGCPINNGDVIVHFCRGNGTLLSCWTAADNDKGCVQIHSIQTLHAERKSCDYCHDLIG